LEAASAAPFWSLESVLDDPGLVIVPTWYPSLGAVTLSQDEAEEGSTNMIQSRRAGIVLALLALVGIEAGVAPPSDSDALSSQQGTWSVLTFRREGRETPKEIGQTIVRVVQGDHVVWKRSGRTFAGTRIELDASKSPAAIDVIPDGGPSRGKRILGIYKLDADGTLTICMADADRPRPTEFKAELGSSCTLMQFRKKLDH
jgi:uncharacterized protein (TIGR03067 family)